MHAYFLNLLYYTKAEIFSYKNVKEKKSKRGKFRKTHTLQTIKTPVQFHFKLN